MSDYSELKRLAEAAPEGPWFGPEYAPGTSYVFDVDLGTLLAYESIDSEKDACLRYVAAANPAAVLALIAENERLNSDLNESNDLVEHLGDKRKALTAERDQLTAEFSQLREALELAKQAPLYSTRRDAERFRYWSAHTETVRLTGPVDDSVRDGHKRFIDAAMSKGEQS